MFRKYQKSALVYRAGYTTQSGYSKSGYTNTTKTFLGHLKPQSINKTQDLNMFGKVFAFHTSTESDIIAGDRLLIDSVNYDVQGVSNHTGLSFNVKQCLLYKAD